MLRLFVDADACPVKPEIYRVARRYELDVTLVANSRMRVADDDRIELQVVEEGLDVADDWIVERVEPDDIVITSDVPLAARCIESGARVIAPDGRSLDEDNIGQALAMRDLLDDLRGMGEMTGGPAPFEKKDRSNFLQRLDAAIQAIRRQHD